MDNSQTRVGIIAEATRGTTPATPAFLLTRDTTFDSAPERPFGESPERRADRRLASTFKSPAAYPVRYSGPLLYDDSTHLILASLLQSDWSTDVLKDASTFKPITVERKFEGGATDPFLRTRGVVFGQGQIEIPVTGPIMINAAGEGLSEATATAAIAGASYVAADDEEPMVAADIVTTDLFSVSSPQIIRATINIENNLRRQYKWGSNDPFGHGLGRLRITGSAAFYFSALADYTGFIAGATGALDITLGVTTTKKYQLQIPNAKVFNPRVADGGNDTDAMVEFDFSALYDSGDAAAMVITRAVA